MFDPIFPPPLGFALWRRVLSFALSFFRCTFFPPFFVRCDSSFCAVDFLGGVEGAHLVSSILRGLFVSFGIRGFGFARLCAHVQLGSRCCSALAA